MKNSELIEDLITKTKNHLERTEQFLKLPEEKLSENDLEKWNILQCCEHLNLYFDFYLPLISKKLKTTVQTNKEFKSGILGKYFAESMLSKTNKMKTAIRKNPLNQKLSKKSVEKLIENFSNFISILEQSKSTDLGKIRIPTSFSKLIQLKLGDTFLFIVNHNERHLQQAENLV